LKNYAAKIYKNKVTFWLSSQSRQVTDLELVVGSRLRKHVLVVSQRMKAVLTQ